MIIIDNRKLNKGGEMNINKIPLVVAFGGGTNSTAMLIGFHERGIVPDLILFADTGGEHPETYNHVRLFSKWLVEHDMPEIITVKKVSKDGDIMNLYDHSIEHDMLPSVAYGFKNCSQKFKIQPQDKFVNNWPTAKKQWRSGGKVIKAIGYDADEPQRADNAPDNDKKYKFEYPLLDWDWGRDECIEAIKRAGICQPGKSSCFFCPNMRINEIKLLNHDHPDLAEKAIKMERNAKLTTIKGLGRRFSWESLLATPDMFADEYDNYKTMPCDCYDG